VLCFSDLETDEMLFIIRAGDSFISSSYKLSELGELENETNQSYCSDAFARRRWRCLRRAEQRTIHADKQRAGCLLRNERLLRWRLMQDERRVLRLL